MAERARAQERRVGADARQLEERGPDSADASLSGIEEFSRLGEKIDRRRFDILRTIRSGLSNARLEAVNNKIKTTIKIGYGYRNLGNLIALVCFASMFVRQVRQCFSVVWADGFPRCRHRFPVM